MWQQPLNAVIGDAGFVNEFGRAPSASDDESVRITAHLLHVANVLSEPTLAPVPQRLRCAALLRDYAKVGRFPRHRRSPEKRSPIFVDHTGTPCAVAYLMRETGAGALCDAVDLRYHNAFIDEMVSSNGISDGPAQSMASDIYAWADSVGLSARDLAVIQPGYTASEQRKLAMVMLTGLAGAAVSFIATIAGVILFAYAQIHHSDPSLIEWVLGALGVLQLCSLLVTLLQCVPGYRKWLSYLNEAVDWCNYFYVSVAALSVPVGLGLLAVITRNLSSLADDQRGDRWMICVVAWTMIAFVVLVLFPVGCVFLQCSSKFEDVSVVSDPESDEE